MAKSVLNVIKKIGKVLLFLLCGFVILIILNRLGHLHDIEGNLDYNPKQVRTYSKKTLTTLYQSFPKETKESNKYQKDQSENYKSYLSTNALKHSDFHTLIAICRKDPTKMNKAYVFACGWNIEYDKKHMSDYAKCLIYYRNNMSKDEKTQISAPLHKIMESCTEDPTGEEQREENENRNDNDDIPVVPIISPMIMH